MFEVKDIGTVLTLVDTLAHAHTYDSEYVCVRVDFLLFARLLSLNAANGSENCRAGPGWANQPIVVTKQQQINWTQIKMLLTQFVKAVATAPGAAPAATTMTGDSRPVPAPQRPCLLFAHRNKLDRVVIAAAICAHRC